MSEVLRIYYEGEPEYDRLMKASALIEEKSGAKVAVQRCYFDIDQNWQYSALIADPDDRWGGWQCTTPAQYEKIVDGDMQAFYDAVDIVAKSVKRLSKQ